MAAEVKNGSGALLARARVEHDALTDAIHRLESALGSAAPGREQIWLRQVGVKLTMVVDLLNEHARSAETADGLLALISNAQPRLLHRVKRLQQEHVELSRQANVLQQLIESHAANELPDYRDIRRRTTWLLDAIRHHRTAAVDLIFEAFSTDLGVAD